ncbi:MAG TPA: GntR family transcriptional regulator [Gryllotalpicola sp.]
MQGKREERQSIQAKVADGLRTKITGGELESGASLSEVTLAEEFGVSRTPVREALKQLETEGLVEIRPRVGTFVSAPNRLEINELFEMKEILEGAAARLMAARGEVPELAALRENVAAADAAVLAGDVDGYAELVDEFHRLIIAGSGNQKLAFHYRMLMNQLAFSRFVHTSLSRPGRLGESEAEHHRVADMIAAKDGGTAERVMREHVSSSRQALLDAMIFPGEQPGTTAPQRKREQ